MVNILLMLGVMVFSFVVGYILISRVPQLLHTPLMSMTNAISAVTILGALILFTSDIKGIEKALACIALVTASFNIIGGFVITDRMLSFFKKSK
ncbi:MAG TPA: NAD(P) transhydrogenase subunit alpha [bacterium]|nr:NAD(P) transhydrogenase subunit alpha [bacterium]